MLDNINYQRLKETMSIFGGTKNHRNDRLDREFGTLFSEKIKCSILYGIKDPIPGGLKKFGKKCVKFDVPINVCVSIRQLMITL